MECTGWYTLNCTLFLIWTNIQKQCVQDFKSLYGAFFGNGGCKNNLSSLLQRLYRMEKKRDLEKMILYQYYCHAKLHRVTKVYIRKKVVVYIKALSNIFNGD